MEDSFILAAATNIVRTILPITSAEAELFGVYADDFATVALDGRFVGIALC